MTQGIEKEKVLRPVGETEMEDLGVVGILGFENFEWQKERFEAEFVKELDLMNKTQNWVFGPKTGFLNYSITRIRKCGRNTKIRNRHRISRFNGN